MLGNYRHPAAAYLHITFANKKSCTSTLALLRKRVREVRVLEWNPDNEHALTSPLTFKCNDHSYAKHPKNVNDVKFALQFAPEEELTSALTKMKIKQTGDPLLKSLGVGAGGYVVKGSCQGQACAIKFPNPIEDNTDKSFDLRLAMEFNFEASIYKYLAGNPSTLHVFDTYCFGTCENVLPSYYRYKPMEAGPTTVKLTQSSQMRTALVSEIGDVDMGGVLDGVFAMCIFLHLDMNGDKSEQISQCLHGIYLSTFSFMMLQMIVEVDYLHSMGIVHRDLKPQNTLVFYQGNRNEKEIVLSLIKILGKHLDEYYSLKRQQKLKEIPALLLEAQTNAEQLNHLLAKSGPGVFRSKLMDFGLAMILSPKAKDLYDVEHIKHGRTKSIAGTPGYQTDKMKYEEEYSFDADVTSLLLIPEQEKRTHKPIALLMPPKTKEAVEVFDSNMVAQFKPKTVAQGASLVNPVEDHSLKDLLTAPLYKSNHFMLAKVFERLINSAPDRPQEQKFFTRSPILKDYLE